MHYPSLPLNLVSASVLDELGQVIGQLDDMTYRSPLDILQGSSIGQHVRHILEFYQCLLDQAEGGCISYGCRVRDTEIETDPHKAIRMARYLAGRLEEVPADFSLTLASDELEEGKGPLHFASSLYRELYYCLEHAIHHKAILRIGIARVRPDIELPAHFGIAPSTLRYRKQTCVR